MSYVNSVNPRADSSFPYLVADVENRRIDQPVPGFQIFHWHEDFQFIYIASGNLLLRTLNGQVRLEAGQGAFINRDTVHRIDQPERCHYRSFLFPDTFLKFYAGGPAAGCVDSLAGRADFPFCVFSGEEAWERRVLEILKRLWALEDLKEEPYAYEVLVLLSTCWLEILKSAKLPERVPEPESEVSQRMRRFLHYISRHYAEDISLADLAGSAGVGKTECLRCFRESLQTTPWQYLTQYRLSRAAQLLTETALPVGTVSEMAGFHQMSHFGRCFKQRTGCTPREYRKQRLVESAQKEK